MNVGFRSFDDRHLLGERATHPIRPSKLGASGALAVLLVLAGISLRRPRPCRARVGQSPTPLMPSKRAQARLEPRHPPLPAHPMTTKLRRVQLRFPG
ncbi:MAG: hypothetical protein LBE78_10220 [Burkholderiaceae bacterium]|jgi:hypothetical protein|nr:hypothetical protein [Burkholderiaceae bacterium]